MDIQNKVWLIFGISKIPLNPIDKLRVADVLIHEMGLDEDEHWMRGVLDHLIQEEEMEMVEAMQQQKDVTGNGWEELPKYA